jgi:hypothetical protein
MTAAGISSTLTGDALITALNGATSGFKNFGQAVAASNVSQNLDVEFADLKALMTGFDMDGVAVEGQTGTLSLGQALQKLGMSETEADTAATQATTQATVEINSSTSTTSTTTTTSKSKGKSKSKKKNTTATTTPTGEGV